MSVIAELQIDADEFVLGSVLRVEPEVHVELERVVPASKQVMPFFWATSEDPSRFEAAVSASPKVEQLLALDRVGNKVLYRVEWDHEIESFIYGLAASGATILEAYGNEVWRFRLRFDDHAGLTQLHDYASSHDISYRLVRVSTETETQNGVYDFGLTEPQREALVRAHEGGYFSVPRATTLAELADAVGITEQSYSERLRRGIDVVLASVLQPQSASDVQVGHDGKAEAG